LASTADRLLSRYAREALTLLGQTIRLVRLERRIRAGDLADRAAIGPRIEANRRTLALLPRAIRDAPPTTVDDDF